MQQLAGLDSKQQCSGNSAMIVTDRKSAIPINEISNNQAYFTFVVAIATANF